MSSSTVLFDTGVVIDLEWLELAAYSTGETVVSAVTIGELAFGLDVHDQKERQVRAARFRAALADFEIIPYGVEEAKMFGALASMVRATGRDPRPRRLDLQIAATAAAARIPLLTTNPADFTGLDSLVTVHAVERRT